jgi:hypothetical protein
MNECRSALAFQAIPALDAANFCPSKYLFEDRFHNRSVPLRGATRSQSAKFFEMGINLRAAVFACLAVISTCPARRSKSCHVKRKSFAVRTPANA